MKNEELELLNSFIINKIPPLVDPSEYISISGVTNLVFAPFIQGMFQGLGESLARVIVGQWVYLLIGGIGSIHSVGCQV